MIEPVDDAIITVSGVTTRIVELRADEVCVQSSNSTTFQSGIRSNRRAVNTTVKTEVDEPLSPGYGHILPNTLVDRDNKLK
jgi:hypothetical protein